MFVLAYPKLYINALEKLGLIVRTRSHLMAVIRFPSPSLPFCAWINLSLQSKEVRMKKLRTLVVIVSALAFAAYAASQNSQTTEQGDDNRKTISLPDSQNPNLMSIDKAKFKELQGKQKLDALRLYAAALQGKNKITSCSGMSGTLPIPSKQDFASYYNVFGANLDVAASFGDTGANGIPSAQNSIQTEPLAKIDFESSHFFYDYGNCLSRRPTLSFGGTIGLTSALVMENLASSTATITVPMNRPMFQDAFGWTLGPKLNFATSHMSQLALFGTLGENYLLSQVTSFKQGDDTITATPVSNQVGQSAIFGEGGVEWKYLNTDIANAYLNKTDVLSPPFTIAMGYRRDSRFNPSGDLKGFDNPEARYFLRFAVGLNKIGNWSGDQVDPGKGYTFKFGVDYERPAFESHMPIATRYFVSANIDINKVFRPSNQ